MTGRREDAARRDEILCALARQLPPERGDSPLAMARWLKERQDQNFRGLDVTIPDNDERLTFEHWVKGSNEGTLAKRIQRAFRAGEATKKPEPAVRPPSLPPLLWPRGMRQRKDSDSKFKVPLLYGYPSGSERIFCECLGEKSLHEVTATIQGRNVGYWPAVRPGTFIELNWKDDSKLLAWVTDNGRRDSILAYESYKDLADTFPKSYSSPTADITRPIAEFAARQAEQIAKILPTDLEAWKRMLWGYSLEIRYSVNGGAVSGQLSGTLLMTKEHLWVRFKDNEGHETPVR